MLVSTHKGGAESWIENDARYADYDVGAGPGGCDIDQSGGVREGERSFSLCALTSVHPATEAPGQPSPVLVAADSSSAGAADKPPTERPLRFHREMNPDARWTVQRNRVAARNWANYTVVWRHTDDTAPDSAAALALDKRGRGPATGDGAFVRSLDVGDIVTLWGKARYPGWENNVARVGIKVYWAAV